MKAIDIEAMTIGDISRHIRGKRGSAGRAYESVLGTDQAIAPRSQRRCVRLRQERARADARAAEKEISRGRYRGPLHGIPSSIKERFSGDRSEPRTAAGSKVLAEWVPDHDATVVERLKEAGAIILGKTNMHEWASGGNDYQSRLRHHP